MGQCNCCPELSNPSCCVIIFVVDVSQTRRYCRYCTYYKLLNNWAGPDLHWWTQGSTIASNCSTLRCCTTSCSSVTDTHSLLWFALMTPACKRDNCGAKWNRGWRDTFPVRDGYSVYRAANHFTATRTDPHGQDRSHSTQRWLSSRSVKLCGFFLLRQWRPHPGKLSNFWLKTVPVIRALTICNHLALH